MPEQNVNPIPLTETSTWFHHQHTVSAVFLLCMVVGGAGLLTLNTLSPLQRFYLARYLWASAWFQKSTRAVFAEVLDRGRITFALPPDVAESEGRLVLSDAATERHRGPLRFTARTVPTTYFVQLLRQYVYDGRSAGELVGPLKTFAIPASLVFFFGGLCLDWTSNRKRRVGIIRRGPKLMDRDEFNRTLNCDGVGFRVTGRPTLLELFLAPRWRRGIIRLPYQVENSHVIVVGATGTGKSQLLVQLMSEIQRRGETAIIYDPDGEFLSEFYSAQRGDIVLNPLDRRCPFWRPASELAANEEALTLAASLFPDPARAEEKNTFFVRAPRQILARLFEYDPTPQELVSWLASRVEIDERIKGTEMVDMLSRSAGPQRSGILASLSMALNAFRLLPAREECNREWSARQWAQDRRGWIFLTSRETTRDIQRPLMSMWLDTLLLRLMTRPEEGPSPKPVWLIVDELASLNKLPTLQSALTRARKYGIKIVLGYQQVSQLQELYGKEGAETITGNPTTKVYFRTGDVATAQDVSKSLGDQEIAREKINYTQTGGFQSRRSKSYSIEVKTERAVSDSQIQGLPNLNGYIRIYDCIARFSLRFTQRTPKVRPFEPRDTLGFVPMAAPEPYEIREGESADAAATPDSASARTTLPAAAGGGRNNTIALPTSPVQGAPELFPYIDQQRPPLLVSMPPASVGATAVEIHAIHHAMELREAVDSSSEKQTAAAAHAPAPPHRNTQDSSRLLSPEAPLSSPTAELAPVARALEQDLRDAESKTTVLANATHSGERTPTPAEHAQQRAQEEALGVEE